MRSPATILTVDDNLAFCYSTCRQLEKRGYRTLQAHTGAETLRMAACDHPSAIVLDVNLPDMDGFAVCRRLKADAGTHDIPVVFLTATAKNAHSRALGMDVGADAFLFAPVEFDQLATVLAASLVRAERRHNLAE